MSSVLVEVADPTLFSTLNPPLCTKTMKTETDALRILACQLDIPLTRTALERDQHLQASTGRVADALSKQEADIVVLPELSSIEYSRSAFEQLDQLAEPLDGPSFQHWAQIAKRFSTHVVFGFARRAEDGFRICMAVIDTEGLLVGYYDKMQLAQFGASMEKEYFVAGDGLWYFEKTGFRIAPIICADIRTPELIRTLVVNNSVDFILHCGAYFRDDSFYSWHSFAMTRAIENQIFFLSLNRAGSDYGNSLMCYPWNDTSRQPIHFDEKREDLKWMTVDHSEIKSVREQYPFLADRRNQYALINVV